MYTPQLTSVKVLPDSLIDVKNSPCVRKQFAKKFGACSFLPYLCIVNQGKRVDVRIIFSNNKKIKKG